MPADQFAVCVTSPPCNVGHNHEKAGPPDAAGFKHRWYGKDAEGLEGLMPEMDHVAGHRAVLDEVIRVLRPDGLL